MKKKLLLLCLVFLFTTPGKDLVAGSIPFHAWVFNLEGYELVYGFGSQSTTDRYISSYRYFKAKAYLDENGQIERTSHSRSPKVCMSGVDMDTRDYSRPQFLMDTNEIFEMYLKKEGDRYQAYIRNRVTKEVLKGKDVFEHAATLPNQTYKLNHPNGFRRCYTNKEKTTTHKEHFDNLAKKYGVPILKEDNPISRYKAWLFDYGGYQLVYGYHYRGYMAGTVTSWPNFSLTLYEDAFGSTRSYIEASPGGSFCTGYAPMSDDDLPGPSPLKKTAGLFEVELSIDHQSALIRNKKTGEEILGVPVEELAANSPDRTFTLRNRVKGRRCYVGQSKMTHKEFFKRLKKAQ